MLALSLRTQMERADGRSPADEEAWKEREKLWAAELSESCQGLALARLIFNQDRSEDDHISALLHEALKLRDQVLKDKAKTADTQNAIGSLAQKQKDFAEAERWYKEALFSREQVLLPLHPFRCSCPSL